MFEMLVEAIAEMLGLETQPAQKQPPQRRQPTRRHAPAQVENEVSEQERLSLEELMQKVAGMEAPEIEITRQSTRQVSTKRREKKERGRIVPGRRREVVPADTASVESSLPRAPLASPEPTPSPAETRRAAAFDATEYASRLRGNPEAARDAFVYSEIFGRPLSER